MPLPFHLDQTKRDAHMKLIAVILASAWALGACSTTSTTPESESASASICSREIPTGTSIATTRCRTKEQIERDAKAVRDVQDGLGRNRIGPQTPGG